MSGRPPRSTLFPYTPLFRSVSSRAGSLRLTIVVSCRTSMPCFHSPSSTPKRPRSIRTQLIQDATRSGARSEAATLDSYRAPDLVASWMSWSHGKGPVKFAARNRPAVRGITGDDFPALRQYQPSLNRARIWWITREVKQHQAELYRQANSRRFTKPRLQHEQRLARFLTRGRPTSPKAHCGRRDSREHGQSPPHHCLLTVATRA